MPGLFRHPPIPEFHALDCAERWIPEQVRDDGVA